MSAVNPFQSASDTKKRITLIGVYLGVIGNLLVSSGVSTLLPAAALEVGGQDIYSLVNTIGGPLGISAMPLFGYLAARNPAIKRPLFTGCMIIGALVVLARALAASMWGIIIPSIFWGFVSAAVFVLGFSMIREMYDLKQAGVYLGVVGTVMSVAMLIGPAMTGALIDAVSWRAVCHVCWVVLLIAGIVTYFGVKVTKEEAKELAVNAGSFDFAGAIAMAAFLAGLVLFLSLGTSFAPFGSAVSWGLLALAVVGLVALIAVIAKKKDAALVPATVLKDRNTLCLTLANFLSNFSNMAVFFFLPAYVLYVMQGTAFESSLVTTLMAVFGLFLGPIFGKKIAQDRNARGVLSFGLIVRIAVTAVFILFLQPTSSLIFVYAVMLIAGIYSSQQGVTFSTGPQVQIDSKIRVQSNSVIQVAQNLGTAIGTAVNSLIIAMFGIASGLHTAMIFALVAAVLALIVGLFLKPLAEEPAAQN